ncbi:MULTISPECIES: recombinase family protein [unclassified Mesorhizobium]|uniref:recombinase family protein n=1 Tax=unclassified Mesorhizobium TaxID=325217 RepID=UPI003336F29C
MFIRAYLRASTKEQDAERARAELERFATERGLVIASFYVENESGAKLKRPELERLVRDCHPKDVILVEQVDRLSRLNEEDWAKLQTDLKAKQVRVVALDLPTSWQFVRDGDEFTRRMADAINGMMLEMLAAISRKDYEDRRRRQAQGVAKGKALGRFKGRPEDEKRNRTIMTMLRAGQSWNQIVDDMDCSRATVAKLAKRVKEAERQPVG